MIKSMFGWCIIFLLTSCSGGDNIQTPKPRAYPKIEFPKGEIVNYSSKSCPFSFEYSTYSKVVQDTMFFNEASAHPCWFDIETPQLNGRVHFSYYSIDSRKRFDELIADAFELSSKHNSRANYIEEVVFKKKGNVSGIVFIMEGPVASPYQFFITDSTQHFLRGALYVNAPTKPDSLKPIYDFLKDDVNRLINSFSWQD